MQSNESLFLLLSITAQWPLYLKSPLTRHHRGPLQFNCSVGLGKIKQTHHTHTHTRRETHANNVVSLIYISWYKSICGFHWRHASVCLAPNEHRPRRNQCSEVIDWWRRRVRLGEERGQMQRLQLCFCFVPRPPRLRMWFVKHSGDFFLCVCNARCSFKRLWRCSHSSPSPSIWALLHNPFLLCFFIIFSFDLIPLPFQPIVFTRGGGGSVKQIVFFVTGQTR